MHYFFNNDSPEREFNLFNFVFMFIIFNFAFCCVLKGLGGFGGGFGSQQSTSSAGSSTSTTNSQGGMCFYSFSLELLNFRHRLEHFHAIQKANANKMTKEVVTWWKHIMFFIMIHQFSSNLRNFVVMFIVFNPFFCVFEGLGGFGSQQSTSQAGASTSTTNSQGGTCFHSFNLKLLNLRHRLIGTFLCHSQVKYK